MARFIANPEQMSVRLQRYLLIAATRHGVLGVLAIVIPQVYSAAVYRRIENLLPIDTLAIWGVLFVAVSTTCTYGALCRSATAAHLGLLGSFVTTMLWAASFAEAWWSGVINGPTLTVTMLALAAKDYTIAGLPIRSPLYPVVDELGEEPTPARRTKELHG